MPRVRLMKNEPTDVLNGSLDGVAAARSGRRAGTGDPFRVVVRRRDALWLAATFSMGTAAARAATMGASNEMANSSVNLDQVRKELTAANGMLRVGFNMGNNLLVTDKTPEGHPIGVARDMAEGIAERLGVKLQCVTYPRPNVLADAADRNAWDVCLIGAEPARAEKIAFTDAYVEIKATYLVHGDSPLKSVDEVDQPGKRIIVKAGAAYELWLTANIKHAEITRVQSNDEILKRFVDEKFDVEAGLEEALLADAAKVPGSRLLDGKFTSVQQAVGTLKHNTASIQFLRDYVEEAKRSGRVAELIKKHSVKGLSVAPPAT
jgi:polar amino acid transport system substrate-binding protein